MKPLVNETGRPWTGEWKSTRATELPLPAKVVSVTDCCPMVTAAFFADVFIIILYSDIGAIAVLPAVATRQFALFNNGCFGSSTGSARKLAQRFFGGSSSVFSIKMLGRNCRLLKQVGKEKISLVAERRNSSSKVWAATCDYYACLTSILNILYSTLILTKCFCVLISHLLWGLRASRVAALRHHAIISFEVTSVSGTFLLFL